MSDSVLPKGLEMRDYLVIYKSLERIKQRILSGRPSGVVIDQALAEALECGAS